MISIIELSDLDLSQGISITYFYAPWLFLHNRALGYLNDLSLNFPDVHFYGVDIEQFDSLVKKYKPTSLPFAIITKDEGQIVKRIVGMKAFSELKDTFPVIYIKRKTEQATEAAQITQG